MNTHTTVGDCLEVLPTLEQGTFDCVLTSPPYNLKINYGTYKDNLPYEKYLEWCGRWLSECKRVLRPEGSLFLVAADLPRNLHLTSDLTQVAKSVGYTLQNRVIWAKSVAVQGKTYGHHRPTTSPRYLDVTHETILHLSHDGGVNLDRHAEGVGVPYADPRNAFRNQHDRTTRCPGSIWFIPQPTITGGSRSKHPATFPVSLALRCLRLHGVGPDSAVLDPFGGTGTTACAAKRLGAACISIELDPRWADYADRRVAAYQEKHQGTLF